MCRPSGALGWVGHGLSTASPRRPTEAACILYAFFGKAKQCPGRGAGALLRPPASRSFLVPLRRNAGSSRQARQIGPPFENRIRALLASRPRAARRRTRMRVPLRRHVQSRGLSCRGIRLPDRSNAPVVGRHQTAGQERLFAATIGTTGFHRTGRREKQQTTATWIAGPPVLLVGKMNARRVPAERPKGLAYPLTCLLR